MNPWKTYDDVDYLIVGEHTLTVRPASHPETGASCYVTEIDGQQAGGTYAIRALARTMVIGTATRRMKAARR